MPGNLLPIQQTDFLGRYSPHNKGSFENLKKKWFESLRVGIKKKEIRRKDLSNIYFYHKLRDFRQVISLEHKLLNPWN